MAILTTSGRTALAAAAVAQPLHLAWGTGSASWDATPVAEPVTATALVAEVGRRASTFVGYCTPSTTGDIIVPTGRFASSDTPTNNIYLRFNFDFSDAPTATIREAAVFMGTTTVSGLPAGQKYFLPAQIQSQGILLAIERFPKIVRSATVRQSFEFVLTI